MTKEVYLFLRKDSLLILDESLVLSQYLEDGLQVFDVLLQGVAVYHDVVEVYPHKVLKVGMEQLVHEGGKGHWYIRQAEQHDKEFVGPISSHARSLFLITFHNPQLVLPKSKAEFGEVLLFSQLVEKICYQRYRVLVFYSYLVEHLVVYHLNSSHKGLHNRADLALHR